MSCKNDIVTYLNNRYYSKGTKEWTAGGTIEREASRTHKPSTIGRELRNMTDHPNEVIEKKEENGYILYRLK